MRIQPVIGCVLAFLLSSCAATSVKRTWKSPDAQGRTLKKAAVLVIDERPGLREGFENRVARQLQQGGASAFTTVGLLSLPEIQKDKPAAAELLRSKGADVIVIMRLVDIATSYRETRPGQARYAETITGFQPGIWYDYYSVAYMDMSPTYGNLKQKVYLETGVYDLQSAQRLWSCLTQTVVTENMDRLAEVDPLIANIVGSMRQDGIAP